jgi:prevent-host-death family protein
MERIGVRDLRRHASVWLKRVQNGESFEVTDRGRPVALLMPYREMDAFERLVASGSIRPAQGDLLEHINPLPPKPGVPSLSEILELMRADER